MSDTILHADAVAELKPIRPGLRETWRLVRLSYVNPLRHAQEMQSRYGNAVMQRFARITFS